MAKRTNFHFRVAFALSLLRLAHPVYGGCGESQVGVTDADKIRDDQITSSDNGDTASTPAKNGRLNYTAGPSWCAPSSETSPYLEVDLRDVYIICAIATQGNSRADQWVKSYQIKYSTNAQKWSACREQNKEKTFHGNYDRNTVVKRFLHEGIQARYIRVYPKTNHGGICVRLEIYGVTKTACTEKAIGLSKVADIPNYRFTASSFFSLDYAPYTARLNGLKGWAPKKEDKSTSSLNIDLGSVYILCAVETRGFNSHIKQEYTKTYLLNISKDNHLWQTYREKGENKIFDGNTNYDSPMKNPLGNVAVAKVVQLLPKEFENWPALRVEVYGTVQGCASSLGIEKSVVANSQLSASSGTARDGRLYNQRGAWCSNDKSNMEYIQVDLNSFAMVGGVATQGHPDPRESSWTKVFVIKYSFDNERWQNFKDNTSSSAQKRFTTASNHDTVKVIWFRYPFVARYVRIYPQEWETKPCLRFDLYGCHYVNYPKAALKILDEKATSEGYVNVNVECRGRGSPEPDVTWRNAPRDVIGKAQLDRLDGLTVSKLPVPLLMNTCLKPFLNRTIVCNLPSYVCQVSYPLEQGGAMVSQTILTSASLHVPDVVKDLRSGEIQDRSVTLMWTVPDSGHAAIASYTLSYSAKETQGNISIINKANTSTFVWSGLTPNTNYSVKMVAVSALGDGMQSDNLLHFRTKHAVPNKGFATEIVAGAVVSFIFVVLLLVILLLVWRRKKRTRTKTSRQDETKLETMANNGSYPASLGEENQKVIGNESHKKLKSINSPPEMAVTENETNSDGVEQQAELESDTESSPLYGNVLDETERRPIPVCMFSEFMNRERVEDFGRLTKQYLTLPEGKQFPSKEAEKKENKKLNRYANMNAYDHSRVMVEPAEGIAYINANYIEGWDGTPKTYIATQGPLPPTFPVFWLMVWNEEISCIVMVTNIVENSKTKCHQYWPEKASSYGAVHVSLGKVEVFADFTIRTFCLTKDSESRNIVQFHFTVWPDHGVPRLPTSIVSLRRRVVSRTSRTKGPTLVHCSAGIGRSGAYIAIDAMLKRAKKTKDVDIYSYTQTMRKARINMIQTKEQYIFVYKAILEALTCGNTEISAQDVRVSLKKLAAVDMHQGKTGYEEEFDRLISVCPNARPDECEAAFMQENMNKNRSQEWVPLDISRVILKQQTQKEGDNYINASFADACKERNAFIITQAPLPHTIEHFWKMVYDYSIGLVVMLNSLNEDGMSYPQYWPKEEASYGDMSVTLTSQEVRCAGTIVFRKLKVTDKKGAPKTVRHLQHTVWPDHSLPKTKQSVLDLITMVTAALQQSGSKSFVVQCSDGVGRSGTFCAVYSILERVKLEQVVDVFQAVKALRVRRPGALETLEQYKFCYEIVQAFLDSFSEYSNFSDVRKSS